MSDRLLICSGAEAPGNGTIRLRRPDWTAAHRHSPAGPLHRTPADTVPVPRLHLAPSRLLMSSYTSVVDAFHVRFTKLRCAMNFDLISFTAGVHRFAPRQVCWWWDTSRAMCGCSSSRPLATISARCASQGAMSTFVRVRFIRTVLHQQPRSEPAYLLSTFLLYWKQDNTTGRALACLSYGLHLVLRCRQAPCACPRTAFLNAKCPIAGILQQGRRSSIHYSQAAARVAVPAARGAAGWRCHLPGPGAGAAAAGGGGRQGPGGGAGSCKGKIPIVHSFPLSFLLPC